MYTLGNLAQLYVQLSIYLKSFFNILKNCFVKIFIQIFYSISSKLHFLNLLKLFVTYSADGSLWTPKKHDLICSDHFIGGVVSVEESGPGYVPRIFPSNYKNKTPNINQSLER